MTEAVETSSPDLLRLTTCPQCEYSLEGLPDVGTCPECGRVYDQSIVIVRCNGIAAQRMNPHVLLVIALAMGAVIFVMFLKLPFILKNSPQFILMFGFVGAICVMSWIDRMVSPRGGVWLLWVTAQGIGVQPDFDPDSFFAKARKWLLIVWWPLYGVAGFIPLFAMGYWVFPTIFSVVMIIVMIFVVKMSQPKFVVKASGAQPGLVGWNDITRIKMTPKKHDRYNLVATSKSWIAPRPVVNVIFDGTPEYAEQLKKRLAELGRQEVKL